jgi:hypothetical protein
MQKDPALLERIEKALEMELRVKLGDAPMRAELLALVVEARK